MPSSPQSRVFSLAFARGQRGRADYDDGAGVDLIYLVAVVAAVKGGGNLDLNSEVGTVGSAKP
jgi:hypothetical protein